MPLCDRCHGYLAPRRVPQREAEPMFGLPRVLTATRSPRPPRTNRPL